MHPPPLNPSQDRLSDWPACHIEVRCGCERTMMLPMPMLIAKHGDRTIGQLAQSLRCDGCQARPAQVWVVAGMQRTCHGGPALLDWAVEIKL